MGVGGHTFQKFGVREDYWKVTGVAALDKGRCEVTKDPADLYVFKVLSLWNGEMTASDTEVAEIVAFLGSLTGRFPVLKRNGR